MALDDFTSRTVDAIGVWHGVTPPGDLALRMMADLAKTIAQFEALRGSLRFGDEPASFEAANTRPFNYPDLPAASIPCGFDPAGLPISRQIAGRPFAEAAVLKVADAYKRDTDWHLRHPAFIKA